jgi:hypothetical protein
MATAFTEVSISSFATLGGLCTPVARVTQRASVFAFTFPFASSFTFTVAVTSIMIVSFPFTRMEISWDHCGARIFAVTGYIWMSGNVSVDTRSRAFVTLAESSSILLINRAIASPSLRFKVSWASEFRLVHAIVHNGQQ